MRMFTPNGHTPIQKKSKSPFAINRKSQIGALQYTPSKQNQKSISNILHLDNKCTLAMSRPMIQLDGMFMDPEAEIKDRQNTIMNYKSITKKLEFQIKRKDSSFADLENTLVQKQEEIMRLQNQNQQLSTLVNENQISLSVYNNNLPGLKKELSMKKDQLFHTKAENQKLKQDVIVLRSIEPRLKEMQQLQNFLLIQNEKVRCQQEKLLEMLRQVTRTLKSGGHVDYREIQKVVGVII